MMIRLTLPGNVRSKKNSKRLMMIGGVNKPRRPMALPSKAYGQWHKSARIQAAAQYAGQPIQKPERLAVRAVAYCKGTLPDLSGMLESVGDTFEGVLWENDNQIVSWDGSRVYRDTKNPRLELSVVAVD